MLCKYISWTISVMLIIKTILSKLIHVLQVEFNVLLKNANLSNYLSQQQLSINQWRIFYKIPYFYSNIAHHRNNFSLIFYKNAYAHMCNMVKYDMIFQYSLINALHTSFFSKLVIDFFKFTNESERLYIRNIDSKC